MADHDDDPTATWTTDVDGDELLHPAGADPARRGRMRDPGALLVGAWFAAAGVIAAVVGESGLDDVPPVIVPASFAVVGLGLLLPKRHT